MSMVYIKTVVTLIYIIGQLQQSTVQRSVYYSCQLSV